MKQNRSSNAGRLVERLAADHGADLVRFIARRVRGLADAGDLAQEAYVRLLRLERKDLIREPRAYLYRIAANILYESELKRRSDAAGLSRWSGERLSEIESGYADEGIENIALRNRLRLVLEQLSPRCRAVLILHRREGMTYEEIAARIGISTSMVKKYLAQGLRYCREHLRDFR